MRLIAFRGFACLILLLAPALCPAAGPVPTPAIPTPDSSLDQFIANAKRQAETGSPEFKQLVAQLDPLRKKQQALLATRRAKETELASLESGGRDVERIIKLKMEIDACRSQLNAVDTQFQILISRIQPGPRPLPPGSVPTSGGPPRPIVVPGASGPMPAITPMSGTAPIPAAVPMSGNAPTPGRLTRTVPPDKIKAAADTLLRSPAPSAAAARTAAIQILSASQPGFTAAEVDQLAQLIVQLASQANAAELQAELTATKQANEKQPDPGAPDPANKEIKFEIRIPPPGDSHNRLQELQTRQTQLEQATIELMKKSSAGSGMPLPVKK